MNLIEYPWLNTCRHVLTAASWCAKLSKLHKKWDFWLSSPFHCLTAVISHFLEKKHKTKRAYKKQIFSDIFHSLWLCFYFSFCLPPALAQKTSGFERKRSSRLTFLLVCLTLSLCKRTTTKPFLFENNRQNDLFILTCTLFLSQESFLILSSFISCPFVFPQLKVIDSLSSPCTLLMVTVPFSVYLSPSHL